ncbi:MAG TPA: ATP-binding protein [Sphingobacteriaceae bacterium]|nr:ATP-binding protein [Sphingobacteriaceae bacterium]
MIGKQNLILIGATVGHCKQIKVFDQHIRFFNPKLIAYSCKNAGIIEKYGSGIRRIIDYFASENLPFPEIRNISDGFMVTVFDGINENVPENRRNNILNCIINNKNISIQDLPQSIK